MAACLSQHCLSQRNGLKGDNYIYKCSAYLQYVNLSLFAINLFKAAYSEALQIHDYSVPYGTGIISAFRYKVWSINGQAHL
jgi:hypothetical protein